MSAANTGDPAHPANRGNPTHPLHLDLNLLRTFTVVYRLGSITAAAEELGISQPAASHALKRLRRHFGDQLFVRGRNGVRPTHLATQVHEELGGPITRILSVAEERGAFDPARSRRRFRIALTDLGEAALLPRILAAMAETGPGIRVEAVRLDIATVAAGLLSGELDAAVSSSRVAGDTSAEVLFHDHYGCLVPRDVPDEGGVVRRADLRRLREVRVAPSAGHQAIADVLARLGPDVFDDAPHVVVAGFTSLPKLVAQCGLAAIVPVTVFRQLAHADDVKVLELPVESPSTQIRLSSQRHGRGLESAAQSWFLDTVRGALQET